MKIKKINFGNLTQREQFFILIGSIIGGFLLFYSFIWAPVNDALDELRQSNLTQRDLNQWISTTKQQIQQFKNRGIFIQNVKKEQLLATLQNTLIKEQLNEYVTAMQEQSGKIAIQFKEVPFDQLIGWLDKLWMHYAIKVIQISVTSTGLQGMVQASIGLSAFTGE